METNNYTDKRFTALAKLSKFRKSETVYPDFVRKYLVDRAKNHEEMGELVYITALGEDKLQTLVVGDEHLFKRTEERYSISFAEVILGQVIDELESNPQLADLVLNSEDKAYEKGYSYGMVALFISKHNRFYYLHVFAGGIISVKTVLTDRVYFVNPGCEEFLYLKGDGSIVTGLENIKFFRVSEKRKSELFGDR